MTEIYIDGGQKDALFRGANIKKGFKPCYCGSNKMRAHFHKM